MKKYVIILSIFFFSIPFLTSASLLGNVGGYIKTIPQLPGFGSNVSCKISDTDRGTDLVQARTLADAEVINNLYQEHWNRRANCDELQKHLDWGTPLGTLATWLDNQANSVITNCTFPAGTTKDAVKNLDNIYKEEAGRNIKCNEALFHLKGTKHDVLRNWLINDATFNRDFQEWKSTFQLAEGATYRDGEKFWLIKDGQRHWVPDFPTAFAWGLIPGDSTYIGNSTWFRSVVTEGDVMQFQNAPYRVAIQNRFRGSGYREIPERLEEAVSQHRNNYRGDDQNWYYEYNEFIYGYCTRTAYCAL
ncbi:MAG: hypothetical protein WCW66_05910 [Patescibacteria group bacterium]